MEEIKDFDSEKISREIDDFDEKEQKQAKARKIISNTFTAIFGVALLAFVIFLIVRISWSDHKALNGLWVTDSFVDAVVKDDGGYNEIFTHDTESAFMDSDEGSVFPYSLIYIPSQGYVQLTVRYNKHQLDKVRVQCPNFKNDSVFYTLTDKNGATYTPSIIEFEENASYGYYKIEFTGVNFDADELSINMYLDGIEWYKADDTTAAILRENKDASYKSGEVLIHDHFELVYDEEKKEDVEVVKQYAPYTLSENEINQINEKKSAK
ncbi:MAG: hypothetical protein IJ309_03795 [Clostridia bacterium]|nr:hypothetical protein [Clostridia bacterium]